MPGKLAIHSAFVICGVMSATLRSFRSTERVTAWTTSADVPWITASRTSTSTPQLLITIDPNTATTARRGHVTVGSRVIAVLQSGTTTAPPFGTLETPANGAVVSGSVAIGGWALDDVGVSRVAIYRDPVAGEAPGQIYIGDATFVAGARPDVEAAFPGTPGNTRAGYGYLLLTNVLPNGGNGVINIQAYADDTEGHRVLLGARTIVTANSSAIVPFGAIDTPAQGGTVSGSASINWGWALTPQPKTIPFDGSTISGGALSISSQGLLPGVDTTWTVVGRPTFFASSSVAAT